MVVLPHAWLRQTVAAFQTQLLFALAVEMESTNYPNHVTMGTCYLVMDAVLLARLKEIAGALTTPIICLFADVPCAATQNCLDRKHVMMATLSTATVVRAPA